MRILGGGQWKEASRFKLGDLLFMILVLSLVFSILAPAVRSGSDSEWASVQVAFSLFAVTLCPVVVICAVIRFAPTSLPEERQVIGLIFKTLVVLALLGISFVINKL